MAKDYLEPPLGLNNIPDVLGEMTLKRGKQFPYDGIWAFSGAQGAGKTLLAMHLLREIYEEYPKVLIISNISIFGIPCIPFRGTEDFEKYDNGANGIIFFIDEIDKLYNSLESMGMPISQMQIWSQNRKNCRVIFGTCQRFTRCAKGLREQAKWNYECYRPFLSLIYCYRVLDGQYYDDKGNYVLPEGDKMPSKRIYIPSVSTMRSYNTLEIVRRDAYELGNEEEKKPAIQSERVVDLSEVFKNGNNS
ncbi:MAG: ATP-binding protein [Ruminococcaceae bacterium]|nr:ATP-binding protein [Oscillospiraceae bacterium]